MYAVIKSGGKQYRVSEGQTVRLERLPAEVGDDITFDQVLLVGGDSDCQIGAPFIKGMTVTGKVAEQGRGKKIRILKFKRRKHHMKRMGHRQDYTTVEISAIGGKAKEAKAAPKKVEKAEGEVESKTEE